MHRKTLKIFLLVNFCAVFECKIFDGLCPKVESSDQKFECAEIFDEEGIYVPLAHLPVGDRTINIYHNAFQTPLNCLRVKFDCPTDSNLVFFTPRCYPGEINEDTIDYRDCMSILSPIRDDLRGARGSYQPSHECTDQVANYTTSYLVTDSGAVVLWGCRNLEGKYQGKHSEGAWIMMAEENAKKMTGVEVKEAFDLLEGKGVAAKAKDFVKQGSKKECKCGTCKYGMDCSMPHEENLTVDD